MNENMGLLAGHAMAVAPAKFFSGFSGLNLTGKLTGHSGAREPWSTFQALGWGGQKGEKVTRKPCPSFFAESRKWHNRIEVEGDFNPGLGK